MRLSLEDAQQILKEHFLIDLPHAAFSTLFLLQLRQLHDERTIDTHEIADEIRALEGSERRPGTKPADQYRHAPLKGLWKKHFFSARFMAKNLSLHWQAASGNGERLGHMLEEECSDEKSGAFGPALTNRIVHRFVEGGFSDRARCDRLTGEWIVFARYDERRFYLTLATHDEGDEAIHSRIMEWCRSEFPFLFEG